jgi:hypothetical protein
MNLEAFSMSVPGSEYHRVVRHETECALRAIVNAPIGAS